MHHLGAGLVDSKSGGSSLGCARSEVVAFCDSEPAGMTCSDTSSGHFFRVSSDSYQLG